MAAPEPDPDTAVDAGRSRARPPVALTVAAHDPLGGSGVAADLTTFAALGAHGVAALTAVTAQHLDTVDQVVAVDADLLRTQLDGIVDDLEIHAAKTGLLATAQAVETVASLVDAGALPAPVVDPVMFDGRGGPLVDAAHAEAYRRRLFPLAAVLTPNAREASTLIGHRLDEPADVVAHADDVAGLGAPRVVVTGGAFAAGDREVVDVLVDATGPTLVVEEIRTERVATANTRGSGCTLSAAIAALLANGVAMDDAVVAAAQFVAERLAEAADWRFRHAGRVGPISHRSAPGQGTSAHSSP